jgi:diguanylate cyclase (GGDEF)-like protein
MLGLLHGAIFLSPILAQYAFPHAAHGFGEGFFALFALLTLLYVVGTAFIVVVMTKEHTLHVHKTAAMTDPLTGLFNRRGFFDLAQKLLDMRARKGQTVSVLLFDLDHFKSVNDRFGHDIGDETLRVFSATIAASMRNEDIVGRLGGEEFVAILPNGIDPAVAIAQRLRGAFQAAGISIAGHPLHATVSIGAAELRPGEHRIEQLLTRADIALYRAKSGGRNRVVADIGLPEEESAPPIVPDSPAAQDGAILPSRGDALAGAEA